MTSEDQNARIRKLEEQIAAQRKALAALLAVIDEKNSDEIAHAIHELLEHTDDPQDPAP
jgi:uncharacterized coiled-coil protein SlyX